LRAIAGAASPAQLSRLWQITGAIATLLPLPILYFMIAKVH
jgi:hypothetical protein